MFGIWLIALATWGVLPGFYNWAVHFGIFVLPRSAGQIQLPDLKNLLVSIWPFLIFIPLILTAKRDKSKIKNLGLLAWALAGSLGAYPRFEYFHFQPAIPFLGIASGLVFSKVKKNKGFLRVFMIVYVLGSTYLFANFFLRNWNEGTRFYGQDVIDVVAYVKTNTDPGDKIFVMNWWDNIYALSDRLPAVSPWVPQLSWYMNIPGVQVAMVNDLKTEKPKLIIFNSYTGSGMSAYIPSEVYNYVTENYKLKEKVDGIDILISN